MLLVVFFFSLSCALFLFCFVLVLFHFFIVFFSRNNKKVELLVSETDERSLSTTLLITPEFALSNAEAFEVIGQT